MIFGEIKWLKKIKAQKKKKKIIKMKYFEISSSRYSQLTRTHVDTRFERKPRAEEVPSNDEELWFLFSLSVPTNNGWLYISGWMTSWSSAIYWFVPNYETSPAQLSLEDFITFFFYFLSFNGVLSFVFYFNLSFVHFLFTLYEDLLSLFIFFYYFFKYFLFFFAFLSI